MKAIKASKKLITSLISFALSLVLCVGVCLAWFAVNNKVGSDGSKLGVRNSDIVRFEVTVHYLNGVTGGYRQASNGNVTGTGTVDINGDGDLVSEDRMRPYGGLGNTFATAVLFEIDYEIVQSSKNYRIYASCPAESGLTVEPLDDEKTNFESALSNTVGFYGVKVSGEGGNAVFSKSSNKADTFIDNDNGKQNIIMLKEKIVPSTVDEETGNYVGKTYVIMDYMPESFIYLSSLMIGAGGSLQSKLSMTGDLTVNIEVYDPENPDTPVGPENPDEVKVTGISLDKTTATVKKGEKVTLTATISPSNATNKALTWTSSDESVATVSGGVVTAVGAGTATITATTKDGGFKAECAVTVTAESSGGGTNLLADKTGNVGKSKIIDNDQLTFDSSGSLDVTDCTQATSNDGLGLKFDTYLFPSGGRTYTFTAKQNITLRIYYTVRNSSAIQNTAVTATIGETVITSDDGTRKEDVAYVMEINLTAGQSCVITSASNRVVLYGVYVD